MMKLRFLGGRYQGRIVELAAAEFTIGRGQDSDLVLDEEGISRRHCRFFLENGVWKVEDQGSTNGVRVNGDRIQGSRVLSVGDRIGVSQQTFLLTDDAGIVDPDHLSEHDEATPVRKTPSLPSVDRPAASGPTTADQPETEEPAAADAFPWGRMVALGLVLAALAWAAWATFRSPSTSTGPAGAADSATAAGPTMGAGDKELAELMQKEGAPGPATGESAPGAQGVLQAPVEPPPPVTEPPPEEEGDEPAKPGEPGSDSAVAGLVLIHSDPLGATVVIDDKEVGTTPIAVENLSPGRHRVAIRLAGYEELVRQLHVPGPSPKPYALRQQAGTVLVLSTPAGAAVMNGTQLLGQTPLLLTGIDPGTHELTLTAPGCDPCRQEVTVSANRGEKVQVMLSSVLGSLEVTTLPAGCRVFVDGSYKGVSRAPDAPYQESRPFLVRGLAEGQHDLRIEHPVGQSLAGKVKVPKGEVFRVPTLKLWVPDAKVVLTDGTEKLGMILERTELGDLTLAESPRQTERLLKARVASVTALTPEEAKQLVEKLHGHAKSEAARTGVEAGKQTDEDGGDVPAATPPLKGKKREDGAKAEGERTGGAKGTGFEEEAGADAEADGVTEGRPLAAEDILRMQKQASATDLDRRFRKKPLTISGVPTSTGREANRYYVSFTSRIRCYVDRDIYERFKDALKDAQEQNREIIVTGTATGYYSTGLVLTDCEVSIPKEDAGGQRGGRAPQAERRGPREE